MSDKLEDAILAAFGDDKKNDAQGENAAQGETSVQADTSAQPAPDEQQAQPEQAAAGTPGATLSRPAAGARLGAAGGKPLMGKGLGAKVKPAVGAMPSATQASLGGAKPAAAVAPPSATATRSAVITPAAQPVVAAVSRPAAAAVASSSRNGNATLLLVLLLVTNLITLVLCAGALAKVSGLHKRVVGLETTLETVRKSADWASKLHGGVTFLGTDKRPQKYIVTIVDNAGKPEFGPVVMRPLED